MSSLPRNVDVLIVGAGFSGLYQLHFLRQLGFNVKVLEAGGDIGGTWYWNCYPGARVDSYASMYQLSIDGVWQDWSFSSMYPARDEIQNYFHYISRTLELGRDIMVNTRVVSAVYDDAASEWAVTTQRCRREVVFAVCEREDREWCVPTKRRSKKEQMNAIRTPRDERNGDGTRTRQCRVRLLDSTSQRNWGKIFFFIVTK
ncbi:hypothetical protein CCMSSC00406_0007122 [Pleurotus cornucopiae]|uniref:Uncharacterized protein n=1 Tax=Pleurotus cornucopiae TaxID=5321 RepID=A0ACB7IRN7_PLECO|nr:hypothetical protein CCMSSC00406_0007122 [Pleurotus cornucopiae]